MGARKSHLIQSAGPALPASSQGDGQRVEQRLKRALEDIVAYAFNIERERLNQATRGEAPVAEARQIAMYLAHTGYGLSYTEVGQLFQRDRSTVAHACACVENRREFGEFDRAMEILETVARLLVGVPAGARS